MSDEHLKYLSAIDHFDIREIMEQYGEDVWNYAYFLTRKHDWADDISQEVFIKAYKNIDAFRGQSSLKTWLLKITRNTSFSHRKLAFFRRTVGLDARMLKQVQPSAENEYMERSYSDDIWDKVMQLPGRYRETLLLNAHYHMSLEEISRHLNISLGTVKSRLHRARSRLADLMGRDSNDAAN
ncbi:RNA polymerase sigma factor [Cohnella endophytica]|uniref:RNA polymerase sigma factor n=1 Tax=Cohnella endophytica TaxID=2419778 RepID=A0A494XC51_9BACL|nr:RNA polymerase sigma factor [Cohnella endophytica]RKP48088.1 RNA polymerase sigma factor [Cohnella endophytica]